MEGLQKIAESHFKCLEPDDQKGVREFFRKLDTDGDGEVSFQELKNSGIIPNDRFYEFNCFDVNGDGKLDFGETVTLYYYKYMVVERVKNFEHPGWRFCDGPCRKHLRPFPDYVCFWCLGTKKYDLCTSCYKKDAHYSHEHDSWFILHSSSFTALQKLKELHKEPEMDTKEKIQLAHLHVTSFVGGFGIGTAIGTAAAAACTIM